MRQPRFGLHRNRNGTRRRRTLCTDMDYYRCRVRLLRWYECSPVRSIITHRQRARLACRRRDIRRSPLGNRLRTVERDGIPHSARQRRAVHPLLRLPHRSILSPSPREVQPRHTPDHLVHRNAHTSQRPLLGLAARVAAHTHRVVSMDDSRDTAARSAHKPPARQRAAHVRP